MNKYTYKYIKVLVTVVTSVTTRVTYRPFKKMESSRIAFMRDALRSEFSLKKGKQCAMCTVQMFTLPL